MPYNDEMHDDMPDFQPDTDNPDTDEGEGLTELV